MWCEPFMCDAFCLFEGEGVCPLVTSADVGSFSVSEKEARVFSIFGGAILKMKSFGFIFF